MKDAITTDFLEQCAQAYELIETQPAEQLNYIAPAIEKLDVKNILAHSGGTSTASAAAGLGLSAIA